MASHDSKTTIEEMSWDDWFQAFDAYNLAFRYQEEKKSGEGSTFFKLVHRSNQ